MAKIRPWTGDHFSCITTERTINKSPLSRKQKSVSYPCLEHLIQCERTGEQPHSVGRPAGRKLVQCVGRIEQRNLSSIHELNATEE
jgi:hypothetical protein